MFFFFRFEPEATKFLRGTVDYPTPQEPECRPLVPAEPVLPASPVTPPPKAAKTKSKSRFGGKPSPDAKFRPISKRADLPPLLPVLEAQALVESYIFDYVDEYVSDRDGREQHAIDREIAFLQWLPRPKREKLKKLIKLLGIISTTGVGKTSIIKKVMAEATQSRFSMLIVVRNHEAANVYEKAGAFHYRGRTKWDLERATKTDKISEIPDWACFNKMTVDAVGRNGHFPAQTVCQHCPHAQRLKHDRPASEKEYQATLQFFEDRGLEVKKVEPCRHIVHKEKALAAPILVIVAQSFSNAMAKDRLVVIDEAVPEGETIAVTRDHLIEWRRAAENWLAGMDKKRNLAQTTAEVNSIDHMGATLIAAIPVFNMIAKDLNGGSGHRMLLPSTVDAIKSIKSDSWQNGIAPWEVARVDQAIKVVTNPLRIWTSLIKAARKTSLLYIEGNSLMVPVLTPICEYIVAGRPAIVLDATMPLEIQQTILARGGEIKKVLAKQNLIIRRFPEKSFGAGEVDYVEYHQRSMLQALDTIRFMKPNKKGRALLTHNRFIEHMYEEKKHRPGNSKLDAMEKEENIVLGHFGLNDKAHDKWCEKNMSIVGGPLGRPENQKAAYTVARAIALYAGADPYDWPVWTAEELTEYIWVDEGSGYEVLCQAPLPRNRKISNWILHTYAQTIVQGIGRPRAVWVTAPILIDIHGGLPVDFAEHGISVESYHRTSEFFIWGEHKSTRDSTARYDLAVAWLKERNMKVTIDSMLKGLAELQTAGVIDKCMSRNTIIKIRNKSKAADEIEVAVDLDEAA
jgi:hypothetical protein